MRLRYLAALIEEVDVAAVVVENLELLQALG